MVSGLDRTQTAIEAGATTFLSYDAWLRIGTVVAELVPPKPEDSSPVDGSETATRRVTM
jgi:hypothetical protein